jgi:hypothetical protein
MTAHFQFIIIITIIIIIILKVKVVDTTGDHNCDIKLAVQISLTFRLPN